MRRSLAARMFASLFSVWFAITLAEPAALHVCPMHNASAHGTQTATQVDATHDAALHAMHAHTSPTSAPGGSHSGIHCTCLGSCTASSAGAVLPSAVASLGDAATFVVARVPTAPTARVVEAPEFFLPFANGPPANIHRA